MLITTYGAHALAWAIWWNYVTAEGTRMNTVAEHFDTPAATYRAHKPWPHLTGTREVPLYEVRCSICDALWPCDASRMADMVLRPNGVLRP